MSGQESRPEEPEDTGSEDTGDEPERHEHGPLSSDADVDAEFARIMAAWEAEGREADEPEGSSPPAATGPTGSTGRETPRAAVDPDALDRQAFTGWAPLESTEPAAPEPRRRPEPPSRSADDGDPGWRSYSVSDEEEHFVPPPPPPLPAGDLGFWGIVVGLLLGPLVLVLHVGFGLGSSALWAYLGGGLCLMGAALLVLRLPRDRDPHDPGNGAQV